MHLELIHNILHHCTGYAPCKNGDWLFFAPGDRVMLRVIEYRSGLWGFRSTFVSLCPIKMHKMVSTKPSESSVMSIIIGNKCLYVIVITRSRDDYGKYNLVYADL